MKSCFVESNLLNYPKITILSKARWKEICKIILYRDYIDYRDF